MKSILVVWFALAACADGDNASLLDHARILGVRATPAHALPGEAVRVDMLAGDAAGNVLETAPDSVTAAAAGIDRRGDGWYVTATMPGLLAVDIELAVDGEKLRASKQVVIAEHADNPMVTTMQVDGADAQSITANVGTTRVLAAVGAGDQLGFAWYTSIGTLDHDRSATPTFTADEPGTGIVLVVVRDPQGGICWQQLPVAIE